MSRLYEIYLSINDFEILDEFKILQNLHLCAQKSVCATNLVPFGEIGAIFSLQLSLRTRFDKINKNKVIAENRCEKHKKSSLAVYKFCVLTTAENRGVNFSKICTTIMARDLRKNFVSAQYLENKLTEFHQILYIHIY